MRSISFFLLMTYLFIIILPFIISKLTLEHKILILFFLSFSFIYRWELLARLCPNTTGADIHSVCTEAGMFAIRARKKTISEKDFLDAVEKVVKGYQKFSATPKYMVYN